MTEQAACLVLIITVGVLVVVAIIGVLVWDYLVASNEIRKERERRCQLAR